MKNDQLMRNGAERQDFLDELKRQIMDEEEQTHRRVSFQVPLTIDLLLCLAHADGVRIQIAGESAPGDFLRERIMPQITAFAKSVQDQRVLIADLFLWEANSLTNRYREPLSPLDIERSQSTPAPQRDDVC